MGAARPARVDSGVSPDRHRLPRMAVASGTLAYSSGGHCEHQDGMVKQKVLPSPGVESALISPPWLSTIRFAR